MIRDYHNSRDIKFGLPPRTFSWRQKNHFKILKVITIISLKSVGYSHNIIHAQTLERRTHPASPERLTVEHKKRD